jgi:exodeoxyribonuclease VII large subunit
LSDAGAALRPPLLRQYVRRAGERLDRLTLRPDTLTRALAERTTALDRVSRHFASLDPDLPLQRGYARVMAGDRVVRSVDTAREAGAVTLHFHDGTVGAAVTESAVAPPPRPPRRGRDREDAPQQDLFSL